MFRAVFQLALSFFLAKFCVAFVFQKQQLGLELVSG